jgi:hypothetical protein
MKKQIEAYSDKTKTTYPSWDALVEAESNGYHVIVVASSKVTGEVVFANATSGGMTKQQARNKASKMRKDVKKEWWRKYTYRFFVRPQWKV